MAEQLLTSPLPRQSAWSRQVRRLFLTPEFAMFSIGSFPAAMGSWMQAVALGWLVTLLGGSALWLGLLSFATMGPLLLAPFGGALVDRVDRRKTLLLCNSVSASATILLTILAFNNRVTLTWLLVCAFLGGAPNAIGWPAWSAFIAELVPNNALRQAVAVNSARFNLTRVIGPALAGVLLASFGAAWCLAVAAAGTVVFLAVLLVIRPMHRRDREPSAPVFQALAAAARYIRDDQSMGRLLISTGALGLLVLPYTSFLPRFAKDILGQGPQALGLLLTAGGAGAVAGAVLSGMRVLTRHPRRTSAALHIASALFAVSLALSPTLLLAAIAAIALGFSTTAYLSVANATMQMAAPPGMLGRLMGIWVVVNAGSVPVGGVILGALASRWSLRPVEVVAALLALIAVYALVTDRSRAAPASRAPA